MEKGGRDTNLEVEIRFAVVGVNRERDDGWVVWSESQRETFEADADDERKGKRTITFRRREN